MSEIQCKDHIMIRYVLSRGKNDMVARLFFMPAKAQLTGLSCHDMTLWLAPNQGHS